jgi:ATP-dependent Clp protease, protease subunit
MLEKKLSNDRIIFLGEPIREINTTEIIAKFLYLEDINPTQDIYFQINSIGGNIPATMAIYDAIKSIKPDVVTINTGKSVGSAIILISAGKKGKRFALPSATFQFAPLTLNEKIKTAVNPDEIEKITEEIKRCEKLIYNIFAEETGKSPNIFAEANKNYQLLSATEAINFGIIDAIVK